MSLIQENWKAGDTRVAILRKRIEIEKYSIGQFEYDAFEMCFEAIVRLDTDVSR